MTFDLVTAVAVADRLVRVRLADRAGNKVWHSQSLEVQPASLTRGYCLTALGENIGTAGTTLLRSISLPSNFWMPQGFTFDSIVVNLQAADQFNNVQLFVEVWPG
ncbi:MAG: hypothetical protein V3S54_09245 [Woeseiaceae bacterium]